MFQARRVHRIYIALRDLFIHEKSTFPTLADFKISKVPHLPSAGRTPWRCFSVEETRTDKRVMNAICNSVRPPPGSFNRCPASDPFCGSLCHGRGAHAGQNFLLGGQPMLICLAIAMAACDPYFVSTLANPL